MRNLCLFSVAIVGMCVGLAFTPTATSLPGYADDVLIISIKAGLKGECVEKAACTANGSVCPYETNIHGDVVCLADSGCGTCTGLKNKNCELDPESPYNCLHVYFPCCTAPSSCVTVPPSSAHPNGACSCSGPAKSNFGTRVSC
jgi:hypothetical protein